MDIELLYLKVQSSGDPDRPLPDSYKTVHRKFVDTYREFRPTISHRLAVICSNGEVDQETRASFATVDCSFAHYNGAGRDIGAFQAISRTRDCDLVVCCGSNVYFWKDGWLDRLAAVAERYGEGVYAPMASYEVMPHLRTVFFAFPPRLMRLYPRTAGNHQEAYFFEHSRWNFSAWAQQQGFPVLMVTWDAEYSWENWRKPPNIFRRGDQSNCMVWDRYTHQYAEADAAEKARLEQISNGENR
jgi:hypothetical protein